MKKEPETYEELIRMKKCVDLTKYYHLTDIELDEIYNFLCTNPNGVIKANKANIVLAVGSNVVKIINSKCFSSAVDGVVVSNKLFNVINHYTPSSGGSSYSGGSSSNNNNNNNNNNR